MGPVKVGFTSPLGGYDHSVSTAAGRQRRFHEGRQRLVRARFLACHDNFHKACDESRRNTVRMRTSIPAAPHREPQMPLAAAVANRMEMDVGKIACELNIQKR
jgi:hypothetical protein